MRLGLTTILIICLLVLLSSCSKSDSSINVSASNTLNLTGNWKWNYSKTGWGGTSLPGFDNTVILSFYSDSTYSVSQNAQIKYSGHFSVESTPLPYGITIISFATYLEVAKLKLYKQEVITALNSDTLSLYDYNIADGSTHFFTIKK